MHPSQLQLLGVSGTVCGLDIPSTVWEVTHVIFGTTHTHFIYFNYCNYKAVGTISTCIHPVSGHCTGTREAKPRTRRVTKMADNVPVSEAGGVPDLSTATR